MRATTPNLQLLLFLALGATGCVHTQVVPRLGESEVGMASYYSVELEGHPTASGEPYQGEALTCAHRTLPFGTLLEVEREDTGDRVEVRVNDRGPHVKNRVVDVSLKAARALKLVRDGVAPVRVRIVRLGGR
jgi:rare lipoprotein A